MSDYTILRDLGAARTTEPYGGGTAALALPDVGTAGVRIDVEQLDKNDVRSLSRDTEVRAIAPVMPTRLIHPVDDPGVEGLSEAQPTSVAWGITAVGADRSARTGAGVVVSVLDTGIDAAHPAFTGVQL